MKRVSRHQRHINLVRHLFELGWKVEVAYSHPNHGIKGEYDCGTPVFHPFNLPGTDQHAFRVPPANRGYGRATFICHKILDNDFRPSSTCQLVRGWDGLARLVSKLHDERATTLRLKKQHKET